MTARGGGAALLELGRSIPNVGAAVLQEVARRNQQELAQQQQAAEEQYRTAMIGVQRDQLAQGDRHFDATLEQGYRTHGFHPGEAGTAPPPSTGDPLLDATRGASASPLSLGGALMHAAAGKEPPARPSPSTRTGWVYDAGSDPDVVRQRAHDDAAASESAADRENRLQIARIQASSHGGGGGGGGEASLRRRLLPAAGFAEAFAREHPDATQSDIARWTRRRVPGLDEGIALSVAGDAIDAVRGKPGTQPGERETATPSDRVSLRRAANDMFEGEPARADSAYHAWASEVSSPAGTPQQQAWDRAAAQLRAQGKDPVGIIGHRP